MLSGQGDTVVRHLRRVTGLSEAQRWTDSQLLEQYVACHDDNAFAELVRRYGRLVRSVCRHVLHQEQDSDDAFQTTFLVFAAKAASIRKTASVASWLYGVARRTAMRAKRVRVRRCETQREPQGQAREQPVREAALREVQAILDEEVQRLSDKYRAAFILCCLEGKSRAEAASQLGVNENTVSSRLARARKDLHQRLARRGVVFSAALCAAELSRTAAAANIPPGLLKGTIKGSLQFAAGKAVTANLVPADVTTLAKGVLQTMCATPRKLATGVLLTLGFLAVGAGLLRQHRQQALAGKPAPGQQQPDKKDRLDGRRLFGVSAEIDGVTCRGLPREPGVPPPEYWDLTKDAGRFSATKRRGEKYPNQVAFRFKYKLAAAQPKAIDLIPEEGPAKGKTLRGIYSLDRDEVKICYVSPNTPEPEKKPRPGAFAARKDSGYVLLVFRDLDRLGSREWKGVAAEVDGAKVPPPPVWGFGRAGGGIGIRDSWRPQASPNEVVFFFKHKLDPTARPKSIDLIPEEGPAKGKTLRGIYALEGDQLKICYVSPSIPEPEKKKRPSAFAARKGSGHVLLVFRVHGFDESVLDKAGFDKAELAYARGVLAAARERGMDFAKDFHDSWAKKMDKRERLFLLWVIAKDLDLENALPATVVHPVEARRAGMLAPTLEGAWHNSAKPLAWKDLKGKVVLLDFMSETCEPCVRGLPKVKALHEQFHDKGLVVICVLARHVEKGPSTVPAFLKKHAIAFPVVVDAADPGKLGKIWKRYGIWTKPTYILVDRTGKVVPRGGLQFQEVPTADEIKKLLGR